MAATTPSTPESAPSVSVRFITQRLQAHPKLERPKFGIICGSGLGGLADTVAPSPQVSIPYDEIPGFVTSTVQGHAGKLIFGLLGEKQAPCVLMVGRVQ